MKKLQIAFLYNLRHKYPDPKNPVTHKEADYDDPQTIQAIVKHLETCGYYVLPIEANENAYLTLYKNRKRIALAFNYSLGINGKDRYAHIPAMCEMLKIPYTGSSPITQALVMNKYRTKQTLSANGIPTLPCQLFEQSADLQTCPLTFPLIVKPVAQGSSAGITNDSVVLDIHSLQRQVEFIIKTFNEPALVEPFLTGREFSVAMIGNPPKILPIIEADHSALPKGYLPLDSLEVKWIIEEQPESNHLICPARLEKKLQESLTRIALRVWESLGILDWCRMDIRCDNEQNPYVLEVNSPPGMIPPEISISSYLPFAARAAGMDYNSLLTAVINAAQERYKKKED